MHQTEKNTTGRERWLELVDNKMVYELLEQNNTICKAGTWKSNFLKSYTDAIYHKIVVINKNHVIMYKTQNKSGFNHLKFQK